MSKAPVRSVSATERPLSPHLQIYSQPINMVMSIIHRLTGAALYLGTLLLAWWLIAVATGPQYFAIVRHLLSTWPLKIVLIGYTWALIHHMLGGIRHLLWDTGHFLGIKTADLMSWLTIIGSVALTALIWLLPVALRMGM